MQLTLSNAHRIELHGERASTAPAETGSSFQVAGLFAGVGGIELGLAEFGFGASLLCEIDGAASAVLARNFAAAELVRDVRELDELPDVEVVTAGFPCQDLSQAGRKEGIAGSRSSLVDHVFRLLRGMPTPPRWLVLENVSYMLHLDRGRAMRRLVDELERLGLRWAYRVVDARAFGLPQRRQRVLLVASGSEDPRRVLLADDAGQGDAALHLSAAREAKLALEKVDYSVAYGFYWTEGSRGIGWTVNAVPTIKGGSGLGIPSPPAIWNPGTGFLGTPTIADIERLQGFPEGWTSPAAELERGERRRWVLVGNAVVPAIAAWLGRRLRNPAEAASHGHVMRSSAPWPRAAYGECGTRWRVDASLYPVATSRPDLLKFLAHELRPLSARATAGFQRRALSGNLRFPPAFLADVAAHLESYRCESERQIAGDELAA